MSAISCTYICRLMQYEWKVCPHINDWSSSSSTSTGALRHTHSTGFPMRWASQKHSCDTCAETAAAMQVGLITLVRSRVARANQPIGQPFNTGLPGDFGRWCLPRDLS